MKMKLLLSVLPIALAGVIVSCYAYEETTEESYYKTCHTNVIGITGPASDKPYVVVKYSTADGKEKNVMHIDTITPPFILEPHNVNVHIDSISNNYGDDSYRLLIQHDYTDKGAECFEIENLSKDKSIEFFVAGSQDMWPSKKEENGMNTIIRMPAVVYRHAPIYYLLFPEKKYTKNLVYNDTIYYFEGNRCGDLTLDKAWTAEEVMALYRAEFVGSKRGQLYYNTWKKLSEVTETYLEEYISKDDTPEHVVSIKYYGVIGPNERVGAEDRGMILLAIDYFGNADELIKFTPRYRDY